MEPAVLPVAVCDESRPNRYDSPETFRTGAVTHHERARPDYVEQTLPGSCRVGKQVEVET